MPFSRVDGSSDIARESGTSNRQEERPGRVHRARQNIQGMFSGRSVVGPRQYSPEARKHPRMNLGLQHLSSPRISGPQIGHGHSSSNVSRHTLRNLHEPLTPITSGPITPNVYRQLQLHAEIAAPQPAYQGNGQFIHGESIEGQHTGSVAPQQRRKSYPKGKSRFCLPKVTDRKTRRQIWACAISGILLATVLSTYLGLALTSAETQEFHVILILIILVTTIYFCHSLICLCVIAVRPRHNQHRPSMSTIAAGGGYANPERPIRVALARDEEAAGIESLATKIPPPAYGLWRESVRVDPDRIFWQRNQDAELARQNEEAEERSESRTAINRPPSYISDNGVDYVIEAAPRSIAPTVDVPLPTHPSEIGRVYWRREDNIV